MGDEMDEKLLEVLAGLGTDGITAFYVYSALHFLTIWATLGGAAVLIVKGFPWVLRMLNDDD